MPLYEYRVLSQKDRWFMGRVDPDKLAHALNELASDGWRVVSTASSPFYEIVRGQRDELLIILERELLQSPRAEAAAAEPAFRPCPKCGQKIDAHAEHCAHCAEKIYDTRSCPYCKAQMLAHIAQCPSCAALSVPVRRR